jgi:hypothetical protein
MAGFVPMGESRYVVEEVQLGPMGRGSYEFLFIPPLA